MSFMIILLKHDYIIKIGKDPYLKRKTINHEMLNKAMSKFMLRLRHMARKYGTNYYLINKFDDLKHNKLCFKTTNTCSKCNYENKIKLDIHKRLFTCENCNNKIDRDLNSAINCYKIYNMEGYKELYTELI